MTLALRHLADGLLLALGVCIVYAVADLLRFCWRRRRRHTA